MPRKTKRQKIVSDYRKKLRELNAPTVSFTVSSTASKSVAVKQEKKQVHVVADVPEEKFETNRLQIVKDLKKTVFWSMFAICAEVVLYFVATT